MDANLNLKAALAVALKTAETQRATVPALPEGWIQAASQALVADDSQAIEAAALTIIDAHSGYAASWDKRPWLADLRTAATEPLARRLAKRLVEEEGHDRALHAYMRRTGADEPRARSVLASF
ncbi:TPA: hypothetical protein ACGJZ4_001805 [Pseudomonas aeruginosa]|uniref:hypothetical protein n=1 Tax=Pseudomonas aeruginosa TaxID=287 RepID=UPI0005B4A434|nr:hypothetical protein [Pseudomonas aeruginosa]HBP5954606.1 hypothetical protein [Pseudomonas aeruginosa]